MKKAAVPFPNNTVKEMHLGNLLRSNNQSCGLIQDVLEGWISKICYVEKREIQHMCVEMQNICRIKCHMLDIIRYRDCERHNVVYEGWTGPACSVFRPLECLPDEAVREQEDEEPHKLSSRSCRILLKWNRLQLQVTATLTASVGAE